MFKIFRRRHYFKKKRNSKLTLTLRWSLRLLVALLVLEVGYIIGIQPDWEQFTHGPVHKSRFIKEYEYQAGQNQDWPPLRWQPVDMKHIPRHMVRAVIVAEDSRFYKHQGFDQDAFIEAMEYNLSKGKVVYGASTISQQTVKNYLLTPSRNPMRKLHEYILTWAMERNVGKKRILEMYLNIAEFGKGIYGVKAAARFYWDKPVSQLSVNEAVELAATLPAPSKHNPRTRTRFFKKRLKKISRHMGITSASATQPTGIYTSLAQNIRLH